MFQCTIPIIMFSRLLGVLENIESAPDIIAQTAILGVSEIIQYTTNVIAVKFGASQSTLFQTNAICNSAFLCYNIYSIQFRA